MLTRHKIFMNLSFIKPLRDRAPTPTAIEAVFDATAVTPEQTPDMSKTQLEKLPWQLLHLPMEHHPATAMGRKKTESPKLKQQYDETIRRTHFNVLHRFNVFRPRPPGSEIT